MTSWYDKARPRLANKRPAWLAAGQVALPGVMLTPTEDRDLWEVELVLDGSWVSVELPLAGVMHLLLEWREDPEAALMNYWGREGPARRPAETEATPAENIVTEVSSPEDLGL